MIQEYFKLSMKSMRHRKLRSWLTILGIVIGIAAIISLISLGYGLENAITAQFEKMGINSIRVIPKGYHGPSSSANGLTTDDAKVIGSIVGVDYVEEILMQRSEIEYGNKQAFLSVVASPVSQSEKTFADLDLDFEDGRRYFGGETNVVVIGNRVAHDLFDKDVMIRSNLIIEGKKFKVVGILESQGMQGGTDDMIMMKLEEARDLFDKQDELSVIRVEAQTGMDLSKLAKEIETKLKRKRDDEAFEVFTPEQLLEQLGSILAIVRFILAGIAAISLAVGGVGIMNSMYTSVKERTRQIGVMKAVGANRSDIIMLFVVEAGLMGLGGGVLGVILGFMFAFSVEGVAAQLGYPVVKIVIDWVLVFGAMGFSFIIGVASGLLPAIKAADMDPVEALRYE